MADSWKAILLLFVGVVMVNSKRSTEGVSLAYPGDDCQSVQSLQSGRNYGYSYDGYVEHTDANQNTTGFRLRCASVLFTVLTSCSARMQISGCVLHEGASSNHIVLSSGHVSPRSAKLSYQLQRFPTHFHFNAGEILTVFVHKNEGEEVANIKKGILSILSLKFERNGMIYPLNQLITIPTTNIYGYGDTTLVVNTRTKIGFARNVTTIRVAEEHTIPWKQNEKSILRVSGAGNTPLLGIVKSQLEKQFGMTNATQSCNYQFTRGRRITAVSCTETHSVPFLKMLGFKNVMTTTIKQNLNFYRMFKTRAADKINPVAIAQFPINYRSDSLMYNEQWAESIVASQSAFNSVATISEIMALESSGQDTMTLFTKLALWIPNQDVETLTGLWNTLMSSYPPMQQPHVLKLWLLLLNDCMDAKWCINSVDCTKHLACQAAFTSLLPARGSEFYPQEQKIEVLDTLASIEHPTAPTVQRVLYFASEVPDSGSILALGKMLNKHILSASVVTSEELVEECRDFLMNIVRERCPETSFDEESEKVLIYAIKSLNPILKRYPRDMDDMVQCVVSAPSSVATAAVQILNNQHVIATPQYRRELVTVVQDQDRSIELRLAAILALVMNEPSAQELLNIFEIVGDRNQPEGLKVLIKEFLKTQVLLSDTQHSSISKQTANRIMSWASEAEGGTQFAQKAKITNRFIRREVMLPVLNKLVNCTANLTIYTLNYLPVLVEVDLYVEINGQNVSLVEASLDTGRLLPVLTPLLGSGGILPLDAIQDLMNIPLYQWLEPVYIEPKPLSNSRINLNKIKEQYRIARTILQTQKVSMLKVKVLGSLIDLSPMANYPDVGKLSIKELLRLAQKLEHGFNINEVLMGLPLYFEMAVPTSLGAPLITNVDVSFFARVTAEVLMEMGKYYYTGRGSFGTNIQNLTFRSKLSLDRTIQLPRSPACGSALHFNVSASSNAVFFNINALPKELKIVHQMPNIKFSTRLLSTSSKWSNVSITSRACGRRVMFNMLNFRGTVCGQSLLNKEYTLDCYLSSNDDVTLKWGPSIAKMNNQRLPAMGVELTSNTSYQRTTTLKTLSLKYVPSMKEVRLQFMIGPQRVWLVHGNLFVNTDNNQRSVDSVFASFNASAGMMQIMETTLFFKSTNDRTILQQLIAQESGLVGQQPGYDVKGVFNYGFLRLKLIGHLPRSVDSASQAVVNLHVNEVAPDQPPLFTLIWSSNNTSPSGTSENDKPMKLVSIVMKNANNRIFWTGFNTISLQTTWNDSEIGFQKIFRFEMHPKQATVPTPFLDARMNMVHDSDNHAIYDWTASISTQFFQGQWSVDSTSGQQVAIKSHLLMPRSRINVDTVRSLDHSFVRLPLTEPTTIVYGCNVDVSETGHVNMSLFSLIKQFESSLKLTLHKLCDYCVGLEVKSLPFVGSTNIEFRRNSMKLMASYQSDPQFMFVLIPSNVLQYSLDHNGLSKFSLNLSLNVLPNEIVIYSYPELGDYNCSETARLVWGSEPMQSYSWLMDSNCDLDIRKDYLFYSNISYSKSQELGVTSRNLLMWDHVNKPGMLLYNESASVSTKTTMERLNEITFGRDSTYSLLAGISAPVENKRGFGNLSAVYRAPASMSVEQPTYDITTFSSYPALSLLPYGGNNIGMMNLQLHLRNSLELMSLLSSLCNQDQQCIATKTAQQKQSDKEDIQTLLKLWNYVSATDRSFLEKAWSTHYAAYNALPNVMPSGYNSILSSFYLKDLGKMALNFVPLVLSSEMSYVEIVQFVEQIELNALMMTNYISSIYDNSDIQRIYEVTPVKQNLWTIFKAIYDVEHYIIAMLANPMMIHSTSSQYSNQLTQLPVQQLTSWWLNNLIDVPTVRTTGFFYPDQGQFITMNNHFHVFPPPSAPDCSWVSLTDIDEEYLFISAAKDHVVLAMGNETIQVDRNGSVWKIGADSSKSPIEFPFIHGVSVCARDSAKTIECSNAVTRARISFDFDNHICFIYSSMKLNKETMPYMRGIAGAPEVKGPVHPRQLPDMRNAANEETFLNAFELTGRSICQYSSEDLIPSFDPQSTGYGICVDALERFRSIPAVTEATYRAYLSACAAKVETPSDTCLYTNMLVLELRDSGIPVSEDSQCLHCGYEEPVATVVSKLGIILVVSLSRDTLALNPTSLLHNLVDSMLSEEEEENSKITLVTYGANGEFYPPYIRTVNGEISSAERVQLASAISRLEFTGPSYSGASTVHALRFVTQNFQNSNLGIAKAVVVVAPESPTQNLVGLTSTELQRQFSSEMMSLNVVSLLNEQDCQGLQLNIIHGISGRCYLPSEIPTLVSNLAQQRSDTVGRSIFCTCNLMDYLTGALSTTCAFN